MLAIRLKRTGKTHFATYRIIVQDSHRHPTSGKVVAFLGAYNPHSKEVSLDKEAAQKYLDNGAQPTTRVAKILADQGVKLPSWVKEFNDSRKKATRNPDKLRKNQPKEEPETAENSEEAADSEATTETATESVESEAK